MFRNDVSSYGMLAVHGIGAWGVRVQFHYFWKRYELHPLGSLGLQPVPPKLSSLLGSPVGDVALQRAHYKSADPSTDANSSCRFWVSCPGRSYKYLNLLIEG